MEDHWARVFIKNALESGADGEQLLKITRLIFEEIKSTYPRFDIYTLPKDMEYVTREMNHLKTHLYSIITALEEDKKSCCCHCKCK